MRFGDIHEFSGRERRLIEAVQKGDSLLLHPGQAPRYALPFLDGAKQPGPGWASE